MDWLAQIEVGELFGGWVGVPGKSTEGLARGMENDVY
jgi:hypothetical protein